MKSRQEIERLSRQKRKTRLLLILLCVMVALIIAAIIIVNVIPEKTAETPKTEPPEIFEGEALYAGSYPIAYPSIEESQIQSITITNKTSNGNENQDGSEELKSTSYTLVRDDIANGAFILLYQDENGKYKAHYPDIVGKDSSFDYESLYSVEQNDGYGRIYKLTYLCAALEVPYFTDRIALVEEGDARDAQLRGFGLDESNATRVIFTYKYVVTDAEGNPVKDEKGNNVEATAQRQILIGDRNVTGVGYYFMVDDRPYIYNSKANHYDYAMLGFYSYINSILISEGLAEDSAYEPYLTTDYKQWVNKTFKEPGTEIPEDSSVIIYTDVFSPLEPKLDVAEGQKENDVLYDSAVPDENKDGYAKDGYTQIEADLSDKERYERLVNALVGKKLGEFSEDIVVTLTSDSKSIDFGALSAINYQYEIIEIEAIVTDGADITVPGTPVGENNLVRMAYYLTIDGKKVSDIPYHGVVDISNASFAEDTVKAIREACVGKLSEHITLSVDYTKSNSVSIDIKYVIDEIVAITDSKGKSVDKIANDSQVLYRFALVVNGEKQEYDFGRINFADTESDIAEKTRELLVGRGIERNLAITVYRNTAYCEFFQDFMTYKIKRADYFITSELVSAFKFQNNSERDPFYGESIYENTMDNEYSLYAINSATCETIAKMLGGIGDTTGSSAGLVGIETVAVGLTPYIKDYYKLYAHTVYFELPRGIIVVDSGDENSVDDYDHYDKIGFTLYISEEEFDVETNSYVRYVGSDLYDIVAKVSADKLVFLKYNFVDFWARRNLMMFDILALDEMRVEFMMEDLKGSYSFQVPTSSKNSRTFQARAWANHKHAGGECDCTLTEALELINEEGVITLTELYNQTLKNEEGIYKNSKGNILYSENSYDTAGTGYFREIMGILYSTKYEGVLTPEEQADAIAKAPLVMRISIKLDLNMVNNTTEDWHIYEFYRCDDRRVMVRQYEAKYQKNEDKVEELVPTTSDVTDFYITTLAFKKIAADYFSLLNGEKFDSETAYPGLAE